MNWERRLRRLSSIAIELVACFAGCAGVAALSLLPPHADSASDAAISDDAMILYCDSKFNFFSLCCVCNAKLMYVAFCRGYETLKVHSQHHFFMDKGA